MKKTIRPGSQRQPVARPAEDSIRSAGEVGRQVSAEFRGAARRRRPGGRGRLQFQVPAPGGAVPSALGSPRQRWGRCAMDTPPPDPRPGPCLPRYPRPGRPPCTPVACGPAPAASAPARAGAMETVTRRPRPARRPIGAHVAGRRGRRSSKMAARPSRAARPGGSQRSRVQPPPGTGLKQQLPPLAATRVVSAAATAAAMRRG